MAFRFNPCNPCCTTINGSTLCCPNTILSNQLCYTLLEYSGAAFGDYLINTDLSGITLPINLHPRTYTNNEYGQWGQSNISGWYGWYLFNGDILPSGNESIPTGCDFSVQGGLFCYYPNAGVSGFISYASGNGCNTNPEWFFTEVAFQTYRKYKIHNCDGYNTYRCRYGNDVPDNLYVYDRMFNSSGTLTYNESDRKWWGEINGQSGYTSCEQAANNTFGCYVNTIHTAPGGLDCRNNISKTEPIIWYDLVFDTASGFISSRQYDYRITENELSNQVMIGECSNALPRIIHADLRIGASYSGFAGSCSPLWSSGITMNWNIDYKTYHLSGIPGNISIIASGYLDGYSGFFERRPAYYDPPVTGQFFNADGVNFVLAPSVYRGCRPLLWMSCNVGDGGFFQAGKTVFEVQINNCSPFDADIISSDPSFQIHFTE